MPRDRFEINQILTENLRKKRSLMFGKALRKHHSIWLNSLVTKHMIHYLDCAFGENGENDATYEVGLRKPLMGPRADFGPRALTLRGRSGSTKAAGSRGGYAY